MNINKAKNSQVKHLTQMKNAKAEMLKVGEEIRQARQAKSFWQRYLAKKTKENLNLEVKLKKAQSEYTKVMFLPMYGLMAKRPVRKTALRRRKR
jgi:ribosome-binding protein aMBF1 (putative translation factor)